MNDRKDCEWCRSNDLSLENQRTRAVRERCLDLVQAGIKRAYADTNLKRIDLSKWPNVVRVDRGNRSWFLLDSNIFDIVTVKSSVPTDLEAGDILGLLTPLSDVHGSLRPGDYMVRIIWGYIHNGKPADLYWEMV